MATTIRYPLEVRERAVRLVVDHREEYSSEWAAICSIAAKFGCAPETLRGWSGRAERVGGLRPGLSSDQEAGLVRLRREVRELRRAGRDAVEGVSMFRPGGAVSGRAR